MSKKEVGGAICQYYAPIEKEKIDWLVSTIQNELNRYHASMCTTVKVRPADEDYFKDTVHIDFIINMCNYVNRDSHRAIFKECKHIEVWFLKERAFESYERLRELEAQGKKCIENAPVIVYEAHILAHTQYKKYRAKYYRWYECKNHFNYNSDCNAEFRDDILLGIEDIMNHKNWFLPEEVNKYEDNGASA
ncbi:MAG: hypothetical protein J6S85_23885 [Methanobrevibacter sp.]|nr:hypothetical protein [Methanobrevibacter sp.]